MTLAMVGCSEKTDIDDETSLSGELESDFEAEESDSEGNSLQDEDDKKDEPAETGKQDETTKADSEEKATESEVEQVLVEQEVYYCDIGGSGSKGDKPLNEYAYKIEYTYDNEGNVIKKERIPKSSTGTSSSDNHRSWLYTYENGLLMEEKEIQYWNGGEFTSSSWIAYKYNENGLKIEKAEYSEWEGEETKEKQTYYEYDKHNRLSKELFVDDASTDQVWRFLSYKYDENGNVLQIAEYHKDSPELENIELEEDIANRKEYVYDEQNRVISEKSYESILESNTDGKIEKVGEKISYEITYIYSEDGYNEIIKYPEDELGNSMLTKEEYQFIYKDDKLVKVTHDGAFYEEYSYDAKGRIIESKVASTWYDFVKTIYKYEAIK